MCRSLTCLILNLQLQCLVHITVDVRLLKSNLNSILNDICCATRMLFMKTKIYVSVFVNKYSNCDIQPCLNVLISSFQLVTFPCIVISECFLPDSPRHENTASPCSMPEYYCTTDGPVFRGTSKGVLTMFILFVELITDYPCFCCFN